MHYDWLKRFISLLFCKAYFAVSPCCW